MFKNLIFLCFFILMFSETVSAKMVQHPSYKKGECVACHTTKDAKTPELKMEMPGLCYSCHTSYENNDFIHGPVAAGACTICHDPHESENAKLLTTPTINELCTSCHIDKANMLNSGENIHPPVAQSCVNCHDPHAQKHKFQLKRDRKKDLCLGCHTDKKERVTNSKNKHGAIEMGDKCLGCHNPHSSPNMKLLKAEDSKTICLTCHSAPLKRDEDGKMLMNMGEHLANNPDIHGPIMWGDCAACHNPHGSNNLRMLKKPFPKKSSQKFTAEGYICFECHDSKKMTERYTTDVTEFRNGKKNTHYLHVNAKRISCKVCHDYHASKVMPHHLKTETKFGPAKFSLRYIESADGGSCNPICHTRRYYNRVDPVNVNTNKKLIQ